MEKTTPETYAKESAERAGARIEKVSAGAHEAVDQATEAAIAATRRMGAAGADLAASATASANRWTEATRERVRRNPFASIGVAVGAALGMVLAAGLWFQRRERWTDRETHAH
jgi:ElaB/YqjD/DUF883 family membrane-anchored ribosome-binding protein